MNKKILFYMLAVIVLYVGMILLYRQYQGSVNVTATFDSAKIYTFKSGERVELGVESATIRGPGEYTVYAELGNALSAISVTVERWEHEKKTIQMIEPATAEVFTNELAQHLKIKNNTVRFLQPNTYEVLEVANNERVVLVDGFSASRSIYWVDYDTAVYIDLFNKYFTYNKGVSKPLLLPKTSGEKAIITSIAVNETGEIALIVGNDLYYYKSVFAEPKLVSENVQQDAALSVGDTKIAYAEKVDAGDDTYSGSGTLDDNNPMLNIIDANSGQIANTFSLPINGLGISTLVLGVDFSPDYDALLLTTVDGIFVYRTGSNDYSSILSEPGVLPLSAEWKDNTQVIYTTARGVWLGDLDTRQAVLVGRADGIQVSASLYLGENYVWFGDNVAGRFGTGSIKRIPVANVFR